jgi:hypothetical protein
MIDSSKESVKIEMTEIETQNNLPVLYIYCDLSHISSHESKIEYMERVRKHTNRSLPDHFIIVGDVEMKFAYITPQEAMYHELKKDHLSR